MRISMLTPEYPPDWIGGVATHTYTMARALVAAGHEVQVITPGTPGVTLEDGVTVVRIKTGRRLPARGNWLVVNRDLAKAALRWRPDVVHAAEFYATAWWLSRFARIPIVTRLATPTATVADINGHRRTVAMRVMDFLERDQTRRSAAVYAPSKAIAVRVGSDWSIPPSTIKVIPNSINLSFIRKAAVTEPPRQLPGRFIVFCGRMEGRKGIIPLGRALPAVLSAFPDLHAVLVGKEAPECAAEIAQFRQSVAPVADRVHLLGEFQRMEALAIVARAELAVFPSLWESFGFVVAEALALGVPVIASNCGGIPEIVEQGRSGWLIPPGDVDALRDELIKRLRDGPALAAARAAARERSGYFDVDEVARHVADLLASASATRSRAITAAIFNSGYRRHFLPDDRKTPFYRLYDAKRQAVAAELARAPRLRILDVGGGYGRITGPFAERQDVTLMDISEDMLAEAKDRFPALRVMRGDARKLPFEDGAFDMVIALDLLCHLPNLQEGVRELCRVVRKGGRLVVDTTNANPLWVLAYPAYVRYRPDRLVATMRSRGVLPAWKKLVRHYWAGEARTALAAAGLDLERTESFGPPIVAKWHLWWCRRV